MTQANSIKGSPGQRLIRGKFTTSAAGVATLVAADSIGVSAVTKISDGVYDVTLNRAYYRSMGGRMFIENTSDPAIQFYFTSHTITSSKSVVRFTAAKFVPQQILDILHNHGLGAHDSQDSLITTADCSGTDLAKEKALSKALAVWAEAHGPNATVHSSADAAGLAVAAWASKPGNPADINECYAIVNEIKADYNTHYASTAYHRCKSATGDIATADANSGASLDTLCNALKVRFNKDAIDGFKSSNACPVASATVRFEITMGASVKS